MLGGTEKQKLRQNFAKIWQKLDRLRKSQAGFAKAKADLVKVKDRLAKVKANFAE